ncbi:endonuclease VII domain-containing protein [Candidatus Woesebacteria bacterium]|nr:endonuclease VII domain-containing protein [Candidatus Woesebacteria bacterium]
MNAKERSKLWYENNKQYALEQGKLYYQSNKERITDRNKEYYNKNKDSIRSYQKKWNENNKFKRQEKDIKRKYNLSLEEFNILFNKQNKSCAICLIKLPDGFHSNKNVDHDHETGKVRGLLCNKCNMGISLFGDSKIVLANAITYLQNPPYVDVLNESISVADMK